MGQEEDRFPDRLLAIVNQFGSLKELRDWMELGGIGETTKKEKGRSGGGL